MGLNPSVLEKFPGCCEGIGKLKDLQLKITTLCDKLRSPTLCDKLSDKLDELAKLDIIDKVSGSSAKALR